MLFRTLIVAFITSVPSTSFATPIAEPVHLDAMTFPSLIDTPLLPVSELFLALPLSDTEITSRAIMALDPMLSGKVALRAVEAMQCAMDTGMAVDKVIVVDMSMPSEQKRLWAFDLKALDKPRLVINDRVAHGSGSDRNRDGKADTFSNVENSHMTSLGLYKISERYQGKNGWSRRLDGLLATFNGKARERAVVMHPSKYVSERRVGNSQGCPAVNQATMDTLEKAGLSNTVLWIDGPDEKLGEEVAACAKKREVKQLALATAKREAQRQRIAASWTDARGMINERVLDGWVHVSAVDATPVPERSRVGKVCELAVRRFTPSPQLACVAPIDKSTFFTRLI